VLDPKPGIDPYDKNHPETRCLNFLGNGAQCHFTKTEGSDYCSMHGGHRATKTAKAKAMYEFNESKWFQKLADSRLPGFTKGTAKLDLSQEIGILRIMLEQILDKCNDSSDLIRNSQRISQLIQNIEKLASSSLKLDQKLGDLMSRDDVVNISNKILEVIGANIDDPVILKNIAEGMTEVVNGPTSRESD